MSTFPFSKPDSETLNSQNAPWRPAWRQQGAQLGFYPLMESDGADIKTHMTSPLEEALQTANAVINKAAIRPHSLKFLKAVLFERALFRINPDGEKK